MKYDVFISYSTIDKHTADAVCSTFENNGIRCWIAPRDILPGSDWAQSIINAIKSCKIMVLIFSKNSNGSSQVTKELNLAVSNNLMVIPLKIDDSMPSGSMEYFLADMHWLDAIDGDIQEQINKLKDVIASILHIDIKSDDNSGNNDDCSAEASTVGQSDESRAEQDNSFQYANHAEEEKENKNDSKISMRDAYKRLFKKCFDYFGCATRGEFWKAVIANWIMIFLITIVSAIFLGFDMAVVIISIYTLVVSVAFISLSVRRLHDAGCSGLWMLLSFTFVGAVILFAFFCKKSIADGNRYRKQR